MARVPAREEAFGGFDTIAPSHRFTAVVGLAPLLPRRRLAEPEDRFHAQKPERLAGAVRRDREREVAEEPLARPEEPPEPGALLLPAELELGGVMDHEHPLVLLRASGALPQVWREDRLWRHAAIAEEPVRSLKLCVV
jgi:hypothetical protein